MKLGKSLPGSLAHNPFFILKQQRQSCGNTFVFFFSLLLKIRQSFNEDGAVSL